MQVLYCLIGLIALAAFVPDAAGQLLPQGTATPRRGELVMKESNFVRMVPQQGGAALMEYRIQVYVKPPYYSGTMPLIFLSRKEMVMENEALTAEEDFGDYRISYDYEQEPFIPSSAIIEIGTTFGTI